MAGICTAHSRKNGAGCDHRIVTVVLDGASHAFETSERELDAEPWNADAQMRFIRLGVRRLRHLGLSLDNINGLVVNGEEGNNMKIVPIITKDITKTNVGTAYVNVAVGANGERKVANFKGCTQFRIRVWANLIGIGPFGFRMIRDGDGEILYENANIALTGERELDPGWQNIPAAFAGLEDVALRLQIKSVTAADDPVVRGCDLGVR